MGFNPWKKFRDSQDRSGERKESSFYVFFMILFLFSEFTSLSLPYFVFMFFIAEGNMSPSILLPLGRV